MKQLSDIVFFTLAGLTSDCFTSDTGGCREQPGWDSCRLRLGGCRISSEVRGGRCLPFLNNAMLRRCLTKTLPYDVLDDVFKKPKHRAYDAWLRCFSWRVLGTWIDPQWNKEVQVHTMHKHFSQNNNLKTHSLIHTMAKPQNCTHCNDSANQGARLKKRNLKHTGEKPRHCQQSEHTSTL